MTYTPNIDDNASLDDLLALANSKFETCFEPVTVGDETLEFLQIADMAAYIERLDHNLAPGELLKLPLWGKIWPTAILLSYFIQRLDPKPHPKVLEIGAGVGVCGLFAAKRGFATTITDIHPDALLFTRINILKNGLQDKARAVKADFTADRLGERFDYILASEAVYLDQTYRTLVKFLLAHLQTSADAEIVLAKDYGRKATKFFNLAEKEFHISERVIGYKEKSESGGEEKQLTTIYRMRARKHA